MERSAIVRFAPHGAAIGILAALSACRSVPRADVVPEREIASAAGIAELVVFREVGADGGPIDELDAASDALTRPEAVRRALASDPGLQSALARVRVAMAEADQARSLPNPVLEVVWRAGGGPAQIEASLTEEFVALLQRPSRVRAADDRLRATAADAVITALDLIGDIEERYIAVQSAVALMPLLQERLGLVARLAQTARARLDAGEGTRGDVVTLDAQRVELEVSMDRARLDERTDRLMLARRIGEPSSAATWALDEWESPPLARLPEAAWVDAALVARPEIQAVTWRLAALDNEAESLRGVQWEGSRGGLDVQRDGGWSVGPSVAMPLPIFDDGSARRAAADARRLEVRHELTRTRRRVVEDVRVAHGALAASTQNLGSPPRYVGHGSGRDGRSTAGNPRKRALK